MIKEKKYPTGLIDADSAPHMLAPDAAINMTNLRLTSGKNGDVGYFNNIRANAVITNNSNIPDGSEFVGGAISPDEKFIVWFTKCNIDKDFDQINFYDLVNNRYWLVMRNNMEALGRIYGGLNFDKRITDVHIIGSMVYWTDNTEEPRKLHIGAAIRATHPGLTDTPLYEGWQYSWVNAPYAYVDKSVIALICKPPAYPPTIVKEVDPNHQGTFINNESFQFATQYVYYSGEESTFSMFSESSMLNRRTDKSNVIGVYIRQDDIPMPTSVRMLRLVVKVNSTKKCFVVKVWDKNVAQDLDQLNAFNAGGDLSYRFYYNYLGEAIDDNTASKAFESVPRLAGTMAFCKNRMFLGDALEGYNAPTTNSSLQLKISEGVEMSRAGYFVRVSGLRALWSTHGNDLTGYSAFLVLITNAVPGVTLLGYYAITSTIQHGTDSLDPNNIPANVKMADLTFLGVDYDAVRNSIVPNNAVLDRMALRDNTIGRREVSFLANTEEYKWTDLALLYNSEIHGGIVFYDKYLRKCSVVLPHNYYDDAALPGNFGGRAYLPIRNYTLTHKYTSVEWQLSNSNAVNEIPEWAHYYAPVQKDKDRIGYFISSWIQDLKYASMDTDGTYLFTGTSYSDSETVALAINTTSLLMSGMGYTFSEGDICTLITNGNDKFQLPVIGQHGRYILLAPRDIGSVAGVRMIFEIYTPKKSDTAHLFFEIGQMYPVLNPGENNRQYSVLEGVIKPDTYMIYRKHFAFDYFCQAMSPDDAYYKTWVTHYGRTNVLTKTGETRKITNVSYSNTWIAGTALNGLSAFEYLNEENLPIELGRLRRLIGTSKVQGEGQFLLAICENGVASLYIEESQLYDQQGNATIVKSDKVIGTVNVLRGDFGTRNPETVMEFNGNVFWYDRNRAMIIKYSSNGLFPVSGNKLLGPSLGLSKKISDDVLLVGGIDPFHGEYLISMNFEDAETEDYRYKMLGGSTAIIVISENKSGGSHNYSCEGFVSAGTDLYSFKNGHLWKHHAGEGYNNFYGNKVLSKIGVAANQGTEIKRYLSVGVEANHCPTLTEFLTEYPHIQSSDLVENEYTEREGTFYASILRDRFSPNIQGDEWTKMAKGDPLVGPYMFCRFSWDISEKLELRFLTINYKRRDGHE